MCEPNPSPKHGTPRMRKAATISRLNFVYSEDARLKVRDVFENFAPKLKNPYLKHAAIGHRKSHSLDAQAVLR